MVADGGGEMNPGEIKMSVVACQFTGGNAFFVSGGAQFYAEDERHGGKVGGVRNGGKVMSGGKVGSVTSGGKVRGVRNVPGAAVTKKRGGRGRQERAGKARRAVNEKTSREGGFGVEDGARITSFNPLPINIFRRFLNSEVTHKE
jgi:hypothetical protein